MDGGIPQLTTGVFDELASSTNPDDPVWSTSPIVQFIQAKPIETGDHARWRAVISDGAHVMQAMVVTQLNSMLENGEVVKGSIIRVERFAINVIQNRR